MFRIVGLLVALLSCLATLTWAQGNAAAPTGVGTPPSATAKRLFESRSNVAPEAAAKKTFNESRSNAAPESAAKKTFNESRSNALRTGEAKVPAEK